MDIWTQARERYAQGGVTHRQLAEELGLPLSSLRRRAADEKWMDLRKRAGSAADDSSVPAARLRLDKQLALTDRLFDMFNAALEDDTEFYGYLEQQKIDGAVTQIVERHEIINIDRVGKLIKAAAELFELQRTALGLHDYKDELTARKLEQDGSIARSKLDLERLKLEGGAEQPICDDGLLAALSLLDDEPEGPDDGEE